MGSMAFINGQVITVDADDSICEALLTNGREIVAVGSTAEIRALISDDAEVIDLQGRSLMPGFIDAHNHLTHQGAAFGAVDYSYPNVSSMSDLQQAIGAAAATARPGSWLRGWGLNYEKYPEGRLPTRWDIDAVSPNHPVCAVHVSGHNVLVNSVALEMAGVDENTPDPDGGMFERDDNGQLTGYVRDSAQELVVPSSVSVEHHGPNIGYDMPLDELVDDIDRACQAYMKVGLTSVVDPQVTTREMPGYMEARKQGKLSIKFFLFRFG